MLADFRVRVALAVVLLAFSTTFARSAGAFSKRTLIAPSGEAASDLFGVSVASADVNGDGYADVVVGSRFYDSGAADVGRVYVYYGGLAADAVADITLTGSAFNDQFGISVAAADVNGDGYADVIVGAWAAAAAGRTYVFYEGPGADATADLTLTGAAANDGFGGSVSSGDVNGDGYADVIVGAYQNDAGGADAGRTYVYYGGSSADAVADLTLTGAVAGDLFGYSVSWAGDVNGDGYGDIIVGAYANDAAGVQAGRAYVYYGGSAPDAVPDNTLTGSAANDVFGQAVSSAGDLNKDGFADVIVGAPLNDAIGNACGRAYVYYGGAAADAIPDLILTGAAAADQFGFSLSSAGDVNADGYGDVIVSGYLNDTGGVDAGRAYVFFGGPGADAVADVTLTGAAALDTYGSSVATGDVNGDGYPELIVGAFFASGPSAPGRVYVTSIYAYQVVSPNGGERWVAGRPSIVRWLGHDPADLAVSTDGGATWSTLASGVGGLEDNEFPLTAPGPATNLAKVRLTYTGQAPKRTNSDASDGVFRIVLAPIAGAPAAAHLLQLSLTGEAGIDDFGYPVASAGDVNGDGFADLIVGGIHNATAGVNAGRAYVYFGGPDPDAVADLTLTGEAAGDLFGISVSTAGDVNRDGYDDVIVGAYTNDAGGADAGRAYIYFGGAVPDAVPDLILTGAAAGDEFGRTVSSAGDVNGDGYGDVIVGSELNDAGGANAGRAYIYLGGTSPNAVADVLLTGAAAANQFARHVSSAGDVNGDGYGDVIVGANFVGSGRAYVYYGGLSMNSVADLTLAGEAPSDNFSFSIAAGDVNGDGYSDVIVGADLNDAAASNAGRTYVFYGGPDADVVADLTLSGEFLGDQFGFAASAADVNADGYADVIVGAYGNDFAGVGAGRAYVFYGGVSPDATADHVLSGTTGDSFGLTISGGGDVNGDGFEDLFVGANDKAFLYDMNRYHLLAPVGGETWNVGATKTVSWLGAEPADLWLSLDGGLSFSLLKAGAGGSASNTVPLLVPHAPTKFARVKLTPSEAIGGEDVSDSLFTIRTSVALLALLAAPAPQRAPGAVVTWKTDPGPDDLAGYRLERSSSGSPWQTVARLTRETSYSDPSAGPATRYRLFAVNGLGEELLLGETSFRPAVPLAAWPLPYRAGNLNITFATHGALPGGPGAAQVSLYDVSGRLVKTVARGQYPAGYQSAIWDGRDEQGRSVGSGIYFLRSTSAGENRTIKLVVVH